MKFSFRSLWYFYHLLKSMPSKITSKWRSEHTNLLSVTSKVQTGFSYNFGLYFSKLWGTFINFYFIFFDKFQFWDCFKKIVVISFAVNFKVFNIIFHSNLLPLGIKWQTYCSCYEKGYIILYFIIRSCISSYDYTVQIGKSARGYLGQNVINKVYSKYRKK